MSTAATISYPNTTYQISWVVRSAQLESMPEG